MTLLSQITINSVSKSLCIILKFSEIPFSPPTPQSRALTWEIGNMIWNPMVLTEMYKHLILFKYVFPSLFKLRSLTVTDTASSIAIEF